MHPNVIFRGATTDENLGFARDRAFGILAVNGATGPLISHVPFRIDDDGHSLEAHLMNINPIIGLIEAGPVDAVIAVSGADSYVSPDWYGIENQVPTWNYVAVHLRGRLRPMNKGELAGVLDRLSGEMEGRLAPKRPWTTAKMDQRKYENMRRAIVPVRMTIDDVQGTWKLSQNKPAEARAGVASGIEAAGLGSETDAMAHLIRTVEAR